MWWDALLLVLFLLLILLPLRFGFRDENLGPGDADANQLSWRNFDIFLIVCFSLDIVVNFRTAVVIDRVLYTGSRTIAIHYAKSWLVLDIVSTLPWDMFGGGSRGLELLRMLKLLRLFKLLNNLQVTEQLFRAFDIRVGAQSYTKIIFRFFGIIVVFRRSPCRTRQR